MCIVCPRVSMLWWVRVGRWSRCSRVLLLGLGGGGGGAGCVPTQYNYKNNSISKSGQTCPAGGQTVWTDPLHD